jgi:predicted amidohydrolase
MHITYLQTDLHWQNPVANRAMLEEQIYSLPEATDLIVLPEMFTTGFTMNAQAVAEPMNLTTFRWLKQMSAQTGAVVTGSYIVQEKGSFANRLIWMEPTGTYDVYDKRHLFRMADEDKTYTAGTQRLMKEWKGWRICPLICYDLRFPVWSRNRVLDATQPVRLDYDLLLYVANWPAVRRHAWKTLLQARAIENLSYVVGVNRIGLDGNGAPYSGDSTIIDFKGEVIVRHTDVAIAHQQTLSLEALQDFRAKFPAWLDADAFTLD